MKKILLSFLTMATIGASAQLPANDFARYEFTAGSGANTAPTTATDLTNSFTSITDRNGNAGDAAEITQLMNGANLGATNINNSTLSFWVKRSALFSNERVIQMYGTGGRGYRIEMDGANLYINGSVESSSANTGGFYTYTQGLDDNAWHHVAIRTTGVNANTSIQVELFVDGTQVMITGQLQQYWTPGGTINNFLKNATLTIDPLNGQYGGDIDDIYLYKDDLTNAEITQLYNYTVPTPPTRYYVDADATGNNDGTSWADAFTDLRDACINSFDGMEIWVAEGTYKRTGTDRDMSFGWEKDSVKIYGGFNGTETTLSQRDWVANETIISGDIGVQGDASDNCYTAFTGPAGSVTNVINYALIDGLIIRDGNANGATYPSRTTGGGFYSYQFVKQTDIRNCTFRNNKSSNGAGVSVYAFNLDKTVNFENCIFKGNTSSNISSAATINGRNNWGVTASFKNCLFLYNQTSSPISGNLQSSLFYFGVGGSTSNLNISITNSTIAQNGNTYAGTNQVGLFLLYSEFAGSNTDLFLKNNIIWDNNGTDVLVKEHTSSGATFDNIDEQYAISDLTSSLTNYTATNVQNTDPLFLNVIADDFSLASTSPAIDAGTPAVMVPALDLAGNPRVVNTIDIGCYEHQGSVGVNEITNSLEDLNTYPNPTTGNVTFSTSEQISNVEIYNLTGQKVATFKNVNTIDVSSLPSGIYTAKVTSNSKIGVVKLIKE